MNTEAAPTIYSSFTDRLSPTFYNQITMDPYSITRLAQAPNLLQPEGRLAGQSQAAADASFQQILSTMLLTSTLSGSKDTSMPGSEAFTMVLFNLMQQMLGEQMLEEPVSLTPAGAPLQGHLTQAYGGRHNGLDFGIPVGTQVHATMDGRVVHAGWNDQGYGNLVIVENGGYRTYYAHLSEIPVQVGQTIRAGSVIGLSGNTGNSTGPHLHYEVRQNGQPIDPTSFTLQNYP